ncbi:hypothetical protein HK102_008769 [Quaeritorhiza haematococci]|nr:hypothetical protein HK102_008769 [Quaeritorhiza haematococci]
MWMEIRANDPNTEITLDHDGLVHTVVDTMDQFLERAGIGSLTNRNDYDDAGNDDGAETVMAARLPNGELMEMDGLVMVPNENGEYAPLEYMEYETMEEVDVGEGKTEKRRKLNQFKLERVPRGHPELKKAEEVNFGRRTSVVRVWVLKAASAIRWVLRGFGLVGGDRERAVGRRREGLRVRRGWRSGVPY